MLPIKKSKIKDKIYDVTTIEDYISNKDAYTPGFVAIETDGLILPVITPSSEDPGIIVGGVINRVNIPNDDKEYDSNNVIDLTDVTNMKDLISKQEAIRKMENDIITSPDNINSYRITNEDAPEMRGLKEAVNLKQIDLDKYETRFGANYPNDKRLLQKNNVSMSMLKRLGTALDIKITLRFEDNGPDVPNPMDKVIEVKLTGEDNNE